MEVKNKLESIKKFLIEKFTPNKIILFGSRARNLERPFSDIDLAIDGEKEVSFKELRKIKKS